MRVLAMILTTVIAASAMPASASDGGGLLTALRVGTTFEVCREKVKAAYAGPRKTVSVERFTTDAHVDANGDRVVRYTGFTQEAGQPRVSIAGACHVRRDGPSTVEIGKPD
jgi:hypothetical protein